MNSALVQSRPAPRPWVSDEAKVWVPLLTGGLMSAGGLGWCLYSGVATKDKLVMMAVLTGSAGLSIFNTAVSNLILPPHKPYEQRNSDAPTQMDSTKSTSTTTGDMPINLEKLWLENSAHLSGLADRLENNAPNLEAVLESKFLRALAQYSVHRCNGLKSGSSSQQRPELLHQDFVPVHGLQVPAKATQTVAIASPSEKGDIPAEQSPEAKTAKKGEDRLMQVVFRVAYRLEEKIAELATILKGRDGDTEIRNHKILAKSAKAIDGMAKVFLGDSYTGEPEVRAHALEAAALTDAMCEDKDLSLHLEGVLETYLSQNLRHLDLPRKDVYNRAVQDYLSQWCPSTDEWKDEEEDVVVVSKPDETGSGGVPKAESMRGDLKAEVFDVEFDSNGDKVDLNASEV